MIKRLFSLAFAAVMITGCGNSDGTPAMAAQPVLADLMMIYNKHEVIK
jgi:hypothetical protein